MKKYEVRLDGGKTIAFEGQSPALTEDWATFAGEDGTVVAAFRAEFVRMILEEDKAVVKTPARVGQATQANVRR